MASLACLFSGFKLAQRALDRNQANTFTFNKAVITASCVYTDCLSAVSSDDNVLITSEMMFVRKNATQSSAECGGQSINTSAQSDTKNSGSYGGFVTKDPVIVSISSSSLLLGENVVHEGKT